MTDNRKTVKKLSKRKDVKVKRGRKLKSVAKSDMKKAKKKATKKAKGLFDIFFDEYF